MPQLDFTTFMSQIFWVLLSFCVFYLIILYYVLPTLNLIFAVRKEKLAMYQRQVHEFGGEQEEEATTNEQIIIDSFTESKAILSDFQNYSINWLDENIIRVNNTTLLEANEKYLTAIAHLTAQKHIIKTIV